MMPILCRLVWGRDKFLPGKFYTGQFVSEGIALTAVVYLAFAILLCMFPTGGPGVNGEYYGCPFIILAYFGFGILNAD